MLETELIVKGRETYIRTGNMSRTIKQLRKDGYHISRATLDREKKAAKDTENDWDTARSKYIADIALTQALTENFQDDLLKDLILLSKQYRDKMKAEPTELNSQGMYALANISKQILGIQRQKAGERDSYETVRDEFYEFIFGDKALMSALAPHKQYLVSKIDRMLNKAGGKGA